MASLSMDIPDDPAVTRAIAAAIHEHWRAQSRIEGWSMQPHLDVPYADLSADDQANNIAAARRIAQVLAAAGLRISRTDAPLPLDVLAARMNAAMEAMAEAEHDGWMAQRRSQGWRWGAERDDAGKLHPSMVPYAALSEEEKEKDRSNIRLYPDMVSRAGLRIVDNP
jgi:hypothetical protein